MENDKNKNLYLLPNEDLDAGRLFMFMYNEIYCCYDFRGKYDEVLLKKEISEKFPEAKEIHRYEFEKADDYDAETEPFQDYVSGQYSSFIFELEKMVLMDASRNRICIYYKKQIDIRKYQEVIKGCVKKVEKKHKFNLVVNSPYGHPNLDVEEFDIKKQDDNIAEHYNDDFLPVNERIVNFLKEDKKSGLIILHGKHGTGKTSYIRYLISHVDRKFIYLPSFLANDISSPHFIPFIKDYRDCILIIEDCEEILKSRKAGNTSGAIENLLNLGDGLLSDALFLKIICTFNTDLKSIDQALLRKGRLKGRYEFKELTTDKVQHLFQKNNIREVPKPMTLAEIYNRAEDFSDDNLEVKKIGFELN
ncbi:MAG: ATPase family associated with various cellular activities (AAA) [Bacteroidetes bacterium ADurb.Bin408]|nr:MAG: ATPase family associated with various cellular activities (AAA) [Bacteroidetes bacterium ADurb.Bin408]